MATLEQATRDVAQGIRNFAAHLQAYRKRPCLLFVSRSLTHADVLAVRNALGDKGGDRLDLIVASPGGDVEAAYLVARELRRRFLHLTAYVHFQAKSAATLLCLAADELVVGSLGELGPLDQQYNEKQKADFPLNTSRLVLFRALDQLQHRATEMYDGLVSRIVQSSGMRPFEACSKAAELTSSLYGPLYSQLDPARLAESARGLEIGSAYAAWLLRRYRPEFYAERGEQLLHRLVHEYPTHGFVLDREEIQDLGLPMRMPDSTEGELLDQLALALIEFGTASDLITLADPSGESGAAVGEGRAGEKTEDGDRAGPKGTRRKHRVAKKHGRTLSKGCDNPQRSGPGDTGDHDQGVTTGVRVVA
jgi:hypothetical protein